MTEIANLKNGDRNITVKGKITEKSDEKIVLTRFGKRRVCEFVIEDESGSANLVVWEEKINEINVGDEVEINNCYITQFKNKIQVNLSRSSSIKKF
ncbi:MAG: OB-fold nucleic acid binding domain-containing protein [Candidatus Aenigmarchaeota archaeon]|nr:OB-fold nucleic acid binding domain-containing protein [Candidatus Aenigmarchaeota archaeon]MDW8149599.1 OB-fold nucleic acid binding domain-containing protein [Candidatus Aenigmarchaeota archaeon]